MLPSPNPDNRIFTSRTEGLRRTTFGTNLSRNTALSAGLTTGDLYKRERNLNFFAATWSSIITIHECRLRLWSKATGGKSHRRRQLAWRSVATISIVCHQITLRGTQNIPKEERPGCLSPRYNQTWPMIRDWACILYNLSEDCPPH